MLRCSVHMTRNITVGIGGPSCCGKSSLARHLLSVLPDARIIYQDDYAPVHLPEEDIPVHPIHGVKDWDDPETAIDWPKFRAALTDIKDGTRLPDSDRSHFHLDLLVPVPIAQTLLDGWKTRFRDALASDQNLTITFIDGFLLYWDTQVRDMLDVQLLIRERKETLKQRRSDRNERISDDSFWKDPPGIFDNVVWPAYIKAHKHLFENENVEHGRPLPNQKLTLLEAHQLNMAGLFDSACAAILQGIESSGE